MALSTVGRGGFVGAFVVAGVLTWAGAMVTWDDPPRSPKSTQYVVCTQLAGVLVLFGMCLTALPVATGIGARPRRDPEPDPGSSPMGARWHRVRLTHRVPDDVTFHTPPPCPSCGDHEVGWTVSIAGRDRESGAALVLGATGGLVGALVARSLTQHDDVRINACDPCFQLDASRNQSRVVLTGAWLSPSTIAVVSALFVVGPYPPPLVPTLVIVALVGVAALVVHRFRFAGRRARATALDCGLGARGRLVKATWFALSSQGVRWSLVVDTVDPTWALALIAKNRETCDVSADGAALESHATELRAAKVR